MSRNIISIDYIKKYLIENHINLKLLSKKYEKAKDDLLFEDLKTGVQFYKSWSLIRSGSISQRKLSTTYESKKQSIENFRDLGYKLITTKDEYNDNKNRLVIHHDSIEKDFIVENISQFKSMAISKLNIGDSYGEKIIESILLNSGFNNDENKYYIKHLRYNFNNYNHIFDFLIIYNKKIFIIEYDGKQHYKSNNHFGGTKQFEQRKLLDSYKNLICENNKWQMIRIPYFKKTKSDIINILNNEIDNIFLDGDLNFNNIDEIASYYNDHTSLETSKKYNVSRRIVFKYYKLKYGRNKIKK